MKIELSVHAISRFLERGIEVSFIREIINDQNKASEVGDGNFKKKGRLDNGKVLEIIYRKISKDKFLVITAYYED